MFEQNIYRILDQNNSKEIKEVLDTVNNKVIWERAIPTTQTPIVPTRTAPFLGLTVSGKCIQASTPSPSVPVDINCNNGVLTVKDDELPTGYRRITEIDFDGNTWYETGEALYGSDVITMTLAGTISSGQNILGSYNGTATGRKNLSLYIYGGGSTSKSYLRYNESLYRPVYGSGQKTITFGAGGTTGFSENVEFDQAEFTTQENTYIGWLPNSTSPKYTGKIVGTITVGDRLKWIPCERASDGAIGYYEAVNGNFIAPSGTGSPTKGDYDFSHIIVEASGTQETVSVTATGETTQTVTVETLLQAGTFADEHEAVSGGLTRKVGVKVLNGTESWTKTTDNRFTMAIDDVLSGTGNPIVCTHYPYDASATSSNCCRITNTGRLFICDMAGYATASDFKAFLAAQYDAGTPVVAVYPLATETTEQVTAQPVQGYKGKTMTVTASSSYVTGQMVTAEYLGKT